MNCCKGVINSWFSDFAVITWTRVPLTAAVKCLYYCLFINVFIFKLPCFGRIHCVDFTWCQVGCSQCCILLAAVLAWCSRGIWLHVPALHVCSHAFIFGYKYLVNAILLLFLLIMLYIQTQIQINTCRRTIEQFEKLK